LCEHLATFAETKIGAVAARNLQLPHTKEVSLQLLAQTTEIYDLEQELDSGWTFRGIKDIGAALERTKIGGILSAQELLDIATTLAGMRYLRRIIDSKAEELPVLNELIFPVRTYPEIEQQIHHCIDDRGEITDRANPKVAGIRAKVKGLRRQIRQSLQRIIQSNLGSVQEAVITQRSDRFVIPVKPGQKETIPGIVHDVSSTGSTLYIEPNSVVNAGNALRQAERQQKREEEIVLRELTEKIAEVQEDLEELLAIATILDLATARARYSLWLEANPPHFIERSETVTLRRLHHPLLVWQQKHEDGTAVVPIDVKIEPQTRVVAITGPNTGGKTVTLKTIGLAALMAKAGIFVPAKVPVEIPWFDEVLADIGDEQSLQQSLSTFSGHIRRISRIIAALKPQDENRIPDSLVLLDEVGAGTDPAEGSALAIALLKYLAEHSLLTVATTHYGELKALKYQDERFENASVEFDDNSLQPTYRLLWGIPGRSNALTIAQRLGLDSDIVTDAQNLVGIGKTEDVNQVIAALENQRREQETKAEEAGKLLSQTERFYEEVSQRAESLQAREQELKLSQEKAVQKAIAEAKAEIAQVIRRLQQGNQTAQKAQQATEALNKISSKQIIAKPKIPKPGYQPQVGEKVRIPSLGQTGEVLSIEENSQLTVRFGLMKMTVGVEEIESLDGKKVEPIAKAKTTTKTTKKSTATTKAKPVTVRTSQNTLDIRGSRVANAEVDLESAIAKATESGMLWIIHGKGTGRLRQGVHEFLQRHPQVEKYELASQKEGGSGVTVVYLK
ncbi:MAG: endonuclease MutS2, partial [Cyanobacteria bacterium P01_F01_bin.143]